MTAELKSVEMFQRPSAVFLYSGLLFLFGALGLFVLLGYKTRVRVHFL